MESLNALLRRAAEHQASACESSTGRAASSGCPGPPSTPARDRWPPGSANGACGAGPVRSSSRLCASSSTPSSACSSQARRRPALPPNQAGAACRVRHGNRSDALRRPGPAWCWRTLACAGCSARRLAAARCWLPGSRRCEGRWLDGETSPPQTCTHSILVRHHARAARVALSHRAVVAQAEALNGFWPDTPELTHSASAGCPFTTTWG